MTQLRQMVLDELQRGSYAEITMFPLDCVMADLRAAQPLSSVKKTRSARRLLIEQLPVQHTIDARLPRCGDTNSQQRA